MKVIDSFIFFNEVEMLKFRLNYLNEIVDYFVICECNCTFSGKEKPYYLDEIINQLDKNIQNKIVRLYYKPDISGFKFEKTDKCDFESDFWKIEFGQRDYIGKNLQQFSPNDILMVSDLDEIPKKEIVKEYKQIFENYIGDKLPYNFPFVLIYDMFYYNFNTFCNSNWYGTVFSTVKNTMEVGCDYFRKNRINFYSIPEAGWHFSTFGDVNKIRTKIQSFSHQEYNQEQYISDSNIKAAIENKEDIYHNSGKFKDYNFLNFPKDVQKHIINYFSKEMYQI